MSEGVQSRCAKIPKIENSNSQRDAEVVRGLISHQRALRKVLLSASSWRMPYGYGGSL